MKLSIKKLPKKLLGLLLAGGLLAGLALAFFPLAGDDEQDVISISGNIEATDAAISFEIPGRVERRLIDEGEHVEAGQLVAVLEKEELRQVVALQKAVLAAAKAALAELEAGSRPEEIAKARAAVRRAQARLDELLAGSREQEIAAANAVVARARAEALRHRAQLARQEYLYEHGIVSDQQHDAAKTAYDTAEAQVSEAVEKLKLVQEGPRQQEIDAAQAALEEAKEQYNLVKKGPRTEVIEQARARVSQAQESLRLSKTKLSYADLPAPISGMVLSEQVEAGEYVQAGTPVLVIGDLENVWLRGYINETDLGRVKHGQPVLVTTDTYPDKAYQGEVSFIASEAEFTPKNIQTEEQRVKLVYRVKIDIQNPEMELKPGMPADAKILLNGVEE
jgi:HlyD family secretion protein